LSNHEVGHGARRPLRLGASGPRRLESPGIGRSSQSGSHFRRQRPLKAAAAAWRVRRRCGGPDAPLRPAVPGAPEKKIARSLWEFSKDPLLSSEQPDAALRKRRQAMAPRSPRMVRATCAAPRHECGPQGRLRQAQETRFGERRDVLLSPRHRCARARSAGRRHISSKTPRVEPVGWGIARRIASPDVLDVRGRCMPAGRRLSGYGIETCDMRGGWLSGAKPDGFWPR